MYSRIQVRTANAPRVMASLRSLARVAPTQRHRYTLVDMANKVRPTSTF